MAKAAVKPKRVRRPKAAETETFVAFKGFDKDLQCRGYQYEAGKSYVHTGRVVQCESGFHVCQNPLDVLDYYDLTNGNRFARVTVGGKIDRSDDKKWAAAELSITAELTFPEFVKSAIEWTVAACKAVSVKGAAEGSISIGNYAKNASIGDYAKNASSGDYATNASSGDYATNASSGHYAKNEATGKHSVITGAGRNSYAKGAEGVWISLAEYKVDDKYHCIGFATGQAGKDGVPADTWLIAKGGKLVPA